MDISILIPSYGEPVWEEMAETRALPSAMAQNAHEVLIDHDPTGTIASVRNGLAEKATGDWLLYLDADDELGPGYIAAMQRAYGQGRIRDGIPPLLTPAVSYVTKGRRQMARFLPGSDLSKNNYLVVGTLVERDLFLSVGGFSDYPHGFEDFSLWSKCWRAGAKVIQVRRAVYIAYVNLESKHRMNWKNRRWQVEMHERVVRELDHWEEEYKSAVST